MRKLLYHIAIGGMAFALLGDEAYAQTCQKDTLINPNLGIADNLTCIYNNSIEILLWIVIAMLIVSGYIYITSMGNADRVKLAKELLVSTLVGAGILLVLPLFLEALGL